MLRFVGMGISGMDSIPSGALRILADADVVYIEEFTSPIDGGELARIRDMVNGEMVPAKRWLVEDGNEILENAREKDTVLLSYGDPFAATTHAELRTRALERGIDTDSIHASSVLASVIGECGLHHYKTGRVATIMGDAKSHATPYRVIYGNVAEGSHTVLLLEWNQDKGFFLDPKDALGGLLETERGQRRGVVTGQTCAIVASRVGSKNQGIVSGNVSSLIKTDFGGPPHTVVIPGRLHFTESDALRRLARCVDEPSDNLTKKIPLQMIEKYVPMVREALEEVRPHYSGQKEFDVVLENTELYVRDAEKFLADGQDEVAVLSIGYADGLVDALRLAKGLGPKM